MISKESVLSFFRGRRPMPFREIASTMGISRSEARALKRLMREMLRAGELVLTRKGLYGPSAVMDLVTGHFEAHRDGYGFVIPDKPGERDIFIPPGATQSAMDNDRVIARLEEPSRRQGRVIRILDRAHKRIAGTVVDISREGCYVKPRSKAIPFDIRIPPKERMDAKSGDKVVVEVTEYPDKRPPSGRVIKVIERPGEPSAEVEAIIEEYGLPRRFPANVSEDARLLSAKEFGRRKDLTALPAVTIDGERAKDFDDAVSIRLEEHGYRLWVHIADVGHYVPWDSAIDLEARKRGTSVYFPDRVIPMLPKELSEELCSLKPGVPKAAFTVEMGFDRYGASTDVKLYRSLIQSDARLTYTSVRKILVDGDGREREKYPHLLRELELMGELCGILRRRRLERGSLDFDLPEPEVLLDIQGRPEAILRAERNLAHMLIEEFMIAANEAVASHLARLGVPSLYRIHEEPETEKMENLLRFARPLKKKTELSTKTLATKTLAAVLADIRGKPEEEVVTYMVLRSLKRARYSPENVGHFGLASKCYTHFTSPIRRYPDLVVHRILGEALHKGALPDKRREWLEGILPDIAYGSSHTERVSDDAERDAVNAMRMWFMKDKVGDEFEGKVVSVTPYGLKVRLDDFYVEGFLHVSYMTDDFYRFDEGSMTLNGRNTARTFKLGQTLTVRVDRVDMDEREIIFGGGHGPLS